MNYYWLQSNLKERWKKKERETGPNCTPFYLCFSSTFCYIALTQFTLHTVIMRSQKQHCATWKKSKFPQGIQTAHFGKRVFQSRSIFCEIFTWTFLLGTHLQRSSRKPFISMAIISLAAAQGRNSDSSHVEETPKKLNQSSSARIIVP